MISKSEECKEIVYQVINEFCVESNFENIIIDDSTRLIGSTSIFDSSDLVQLIVEIEDRINDTFDLQITLTDEKAMSRTTSPFVNIGTLIKFIIENINE